MDPRRKKDSNDSDTEEEKQKKSTKAEDEYLKSPRIDKEEEKLKSIQSAILTRMDKMGLPVPGNLTANIEGEEYSDPQPSTSRRSPTFPRYIKSPFKLKSEEHHEPQPSTSRSSQNLPLINPFDDMRLPVRGNVTTNLEGEEYRDPQPSAWMSTPRISLVNPFESKSEKHHKPQLSTWSSQNLPLKNPFELKSSKKHQESQPSNLEGEEYRDSQASAWMSTPRISLVNPFESKSEKHHKPQPSTWSSQNLPLKNPFERVPVRGNVTTNIGEEYRDPQPSTSRSSQNLPLINPFDTVFEVKRECEPHGELVEKAVKSTYASDYSHQSETEPRKFKFELYTEETPQRTQKFTYYVDSYNKRWRHCNSCNRSLPDFSEELEELVSTTQASDSEDEDKGQQSPEKLAEAEDQNPTAHDVNLPESENSNACLEWGSDKDQEEEVPQIPATVELEEEEQLEAPQLLVEAPLQLPAPKKDEDLHSSSGSSLGSDVYLLDESMMEEVEHQSEEQGESSDSEGSPSSSMVRHVGPYLMKIFEDETKQVTQSLVGQVPGSEMKPWMEPPPCPSSAIDAPPGPSHAPPRCGETLLIPDEGSVEAVFIPHEEISRESTATPHEEMSESSRSDKTSSDITFAPREDLSGGVVIQGEDLSGGVVIQGEDLSEEAAVVPEAEMPEDLAVVSQPGSFGLEEFSSGTSETGTFSTSGSTRSPPLEHAMDQVQPEQAAMELDASPERNPPEAAVPPEPVAMEVDPLPGPSAAEPQPDPSAEVNPQPDPSHAVDPQPDPSHEEGMGMTYNWRWPIPEWAEHAKGLEGFKVFDTRTFYRYFSEEDQKIIRILVGALNHLKNILLEADAPFCYFEEDIRCIVINHYFMFQYVKMKDIDSQIVQDWLRRCAFLNYYHVLNIQRRTIRYVFDGGIHICCRGTLDYLKVTAFQLDALNHSVYRSRGCTSIAKKRLAADIIKKIHLLETKSRTQWRSFVKKSSVTSKYFGEIEKQRIEQDFYRKFFPAYKLLVRILQQLRLNCMPEGVQLPELHSLLDELNPLLFDTLSVHLNSDSLNEHLSNVLEHQKVLLDREAMAEYARTYIAKEFKAEDNYDKLFQQLKARLRRGRRDRTHETEEVKKIKKVIMTNFKLFMKTIKALGGPLGFLFESILFILAKSMDLFTCLDLYQLKSVQTSQTTRQQVTEQPDQVRQNEIFDQYVIELKNVVVGLQRLIHRKIIAIQVKLKYVKDDKYGDPFNKVVDLIKLRIHKLDCVNTDKNLYKHPEYRSYSGRISSQTWREKRDEAKAVLKRYSSERDNEEFQYNGQIPLSELPDSDRKFIEKQKDLLKKCVYNRMVKEFLELCTNLRKLKRDLQSKIQEQLYVPAAAPPADAAAALADATAAVAVLADAAVVAVPAPAAVVAAVAAAPHAASAAVDVLADAAAALADAATAVAVLADVASAAAAPADNA